MKVYAKNSFDRFGDDLTELIVSYLWFEDKVRLECVSKQWRRLVFNKQFVIELMINSNNKNSINGVLDDRRQVNKQHLESVLKKCPNIIRVVLCLTDNSSVLSLIGRYCHRIKSLCYTNEFDNALDFFRIYGHKLEELYLLIYREYNTFEDNTEDNKMLTSFLKCCPNVKIISYPIDVLIIEDKEYLPKLESINPHYADHIKLACYADMSKKVAGNILLVFKLLNLFKSSLTFLETFF